MKFKLGTSVPAPAPLSEAKAAPAPLAPDSPAAPLEKIKSQLAELNSSIESLQEGALVLQIQQIHGAMLNSPEITYALSDEEIGVLFRALQKAKSTSLAEAKAPKKLSKKKELEHAFASLLGADL